MASSAAQWFAATRPPFLTVSIVGVLLGLATATYEHAFRSPALAALTLLFALVAHAGANVINDYYDALSGCDAVNTDRIAPFTGGSRFIQNNVLTERQTAIFGYVLLASIVPAGLWLTCQSGPLLLLIGGAGLISGWAYSAPPFKLQSRSLGEIGIMLAWLSIVLGADYVQAQSISPPALIAGLAYAPLVANVLFVNQVPDRIADATVCKNTLIVRWSAAITGWGSLVLYTLSITTLGVGLVTRMIPVSTALAFFGLIPAGVALRALFTDPTNPEQLRVAIPATITSCLLFGGLFAVGLVIGR